MDGPLQNVYFYVDQKSQMPICNQQGQLWYLN